MPPFAGGVRSPSSTTSSSPSAIPGSIDVPRARMIVPAPSFSPSERASDGAISSLPSDASPSTAAPGPAEAATSSRGSRHALARAGPPSMASSTPK